MPQIQVEKGRGTIITAVAHYHEIIINVNTITVNQLLLPSCDCLLTRPRLDKTKRSGSVRLGERAFTYRTLEGSRSEPRLPSGRRGRPTAPPPPGPESREEPTWWDESSAGREASGQSSERRGRVEQPKGGPRLYDGVTSPASAASAEQLWRETARLALPRAGGRRLALSMINGTPSYRIVSFYFIVLYLNALLKRCRFESCSRGRLPARAKFSHINGLTTCS